MQRLALAVIIGVGVVLADNYVYYGVYEVAFVAALAYLALSHKD